MSGSSRQSSLSGSESGSKASLNELRRVVDEARVKSEDGSTLTTEYGIQVTTGSGLERVSEEIAGRMQRFVSEQMGTGRDEPVEIPGMQPIPGGSEAASTNPSESRIEPMSERDLAEQREAMREVSDRLAAALFDRSEASPQGRALAQAAAELSATQGVQYQGSVVSAAIQSLSEADVDSKQLALGMLQDARALQISVPEGSSASLARAAQELRTSLDKTPDAGAALEARGAYQVAAEPGSSTAEGREAAVDGLRSAADRVDLEDGASAKEAGQALRGLADALESGASDASLQAALQRADAATEALINQAARETAEVLRDPALSDAFRELPAQAEKTYERFERAVQELGPEDATAHTLHLLQALREQVDTQRGNDRSSRSQEQEGVEAGGAKSDGRQADDAGGSRSSRTEGIRSLLGEESSAYSDSQLDAAYAPGFAERVQELGITSDDVTAALDELREHAGELGRDPGDIDRSMALEALVERENAFDREERSGERDASDSGAARREEAEKAEAAEAQAEMSMGE